MRNILFTLFVITLTFSIVHSQDAKKKKEKVECPVLGIDLGTTYSCVGIYKGGRVEIIPNELGNRITPSVVSFTDDERLIGESAKHQTTINPTRTLYDVKRLIGRKFTDKHVQSDKKYLPFEIVDQGGKPYIKAQVNGQDKVYSPEEVSAMILTKLKEIGETFIGQKIKNTVVTVPAYFNDAQRSATKDAGTIAGMNVVRLLNEPTAAAIAYGLDKKVGEQNVLVFDLGGGTFDVSILQIDNGIFEVIATNGDTHLGGEDFDQRVMNHYIKVIKKKKQIDISSDKRSLAKLKKAVEQAKRTLSSSHEAKLEIESLYEGLDFSEILTRARFEDLNNDLFKKTMGPVQQALDDADLKKSQIDEIVLVGGSTRIPKVRQLVKDFFNGKEPNTGINPDEAIAFGAAVQGGIICGDTSEETKDIVIIDATPLTLGIETVGGVMSKIIGKGTFIPTKKSQVFTTNADNQGTIKISVFEGERTLVKDNHRLGEFDLNDIPPAEKGKPQVEVTFEIDANGILQVSATLKETGKSEKITITNDDERLSKEQIEQMLKDSEEFAEQDKIAKERIESKLSLQNYMDHIQKQVSDKLKDKIDDDDQATIKEAIQDVKEWMEKNSLGEKEQNDEQYEDLRAICDPIINKLTGNTQAEQPTPTENDDFKEDDTSLEQELDLESELEQEEASELEEASEDHFDL